MTPALLDARELLKHFTSEGLPSGELQPLQLHKGYGVHRDHPYTPIHSRTNILVHGYTRMRTLAYLYMNVNVHKN